MKRGYYFLHVAAMWIALSTFFAIPAHAASSDDLLWGRAPVDSQGVRRAQVLTDGKAARAGDIWKSDLTAVFASASAFATYDLGAVRAVTAVWLQGDGNDTYELEGSVDGAHFAPLWRAPPSGEAGLQSRFASGLSASARYVRVRASGGDGAYSLSELQIFERAEQFPPVVAELRGTPVERTVRDRTLLFGFAAVVALLLAYRGAARWWLAVLLAMVVVSALAWLAGVHDAWPLESREIGMIRATVALVAAIAVLRESFSPTRFAARRAWALSALGVCGVVGFLAFYNLGHPQFWDNGKQTWTFVHFLDLRQYYPTAKYFREIGYRGVYEADVAAYVEDQHASLEQLRDLPMRDLSNLKETTVGRERAAIQSIKSRFSPERWADYKSDAAYFRTAMGKSQYLETMIDMGGNATPVWMGIAHLLFGSIRASNEAFLWTALLDPILLLAAFFAIGRTFGLRTAFICMTIFGANDFIMYGTCWAGATLRHDWLAYIGLGAAAIKSRRYLLGGALLAFSTSIRAFPAVTLVGASLPAVWWAFDEWRQTRRAPALGKLLEAQRPVLRVLAGAALAFAVLFAFSAVVLPVDAWADWLSKVGQLSSDPHPSHISLRSLIAGGGADQASVLRARMPVFVGAVLAYVAAVVVAARGKRLEQCAVLALVLVPVLFYPANYYIHLVFLLPLLVVERSRSEPLTPLDATLVLTLLFLCTAQYGTVLVTERPLHFYLTSVLLFAAITYMLFVLLRSQAVAAGWFAVEPSDSPKLSAAAVPLVEIPEAGAAK